MSGDLNGKPQPKDDPEMVTLWDIAARRQIGVVGFSAGNNAFII